MSMNNKDFAKFCTQNSTRVLKYREKYVEMDIGTPDTSVIVTLYYELHTKHGNGVWLCTADENGLPRLTVAEKTCCSALDTFRTTYKHRCSELSAIITKLIETMPECGDNTFAWLAEIGEIIEYSDTDYKVGIDLGEHTFYFYQKKDRDPKASYPNQYRTYEMFGKKWSSSGSPRLVLLSALNAELTKLECTGKLFDPKET